MSCCVFFLFKQSAAYEMRISDWSSEWCSSDLDHQPAAIGGAGAAPHRGSRGGRERRDRDPSDDVSRAQLRPPPGRRPRGGDLPRRAQERDRGSDADFDRFVRKNQCRSEEHTSELQSLMRISYAVFCLKKKKKDNNIKKQHNITD